jgi:predicted  nucleic acid-binding Zn-ribbon protein
MKILALCLALGMSVGASLAQEATDKYMPNTDKMTTYYWVAQNEEAAHKITKEESEQAKVIGTAFDEIDQLKRRLTAAAARDQGYQKRLTALEEIATAAAKKAKQDDYKIAELERVVAGLQKQVTILHGKKADK